jgi:hypothetical protein
MGINGNFRISAAHCLKYHIFVSFLTAVAV